MDLSFLRSLQFSRILVTGGAGFIGSHLVEELVRQGFHVRAVDNLSTGKIRNLKKVLGSSNFEFLKGDLTDLREAEQALKNIDMVFHLAAEPSVLESYHERAKHFKNNFFSTFNVLEAAKQNRTVKWIIFSSSSTVYGEAGVLPTPENYGPLLPISIYGASKLSCEALLSTYSHYFGFKVTIFRLANIIGSRLTHGVILDFINKLSIDKKKLEILGNGRQEKSYLYIKDAIEGFFYGIRSQESKETSLEVFNLGSSDRITVNEIAEIVVKEMGLENVRFIYRDDVGDGRGWLGDVRKMHISIMKLLKTGWKPKHTSREAVEHTVREILEEIQK